MRNFRELKVWERAHALALATYRGTEAFPRDETYGLRQQLRRAAVSIPSNIAEGCNRGSDAEMVRFLRIALGSTGEVEYQLLLAQELGYVNEERATALQREAVEIAKMINAFIQSLSSPK